MSTESPATVSALSDTFVPDPPDALLLRRVGLSAEEYERVVRLLRRKPNLVELGIFGAMWSEHCSYKTSKRHLRKFPVEGRGVIQGPGENAGVMELGGDWAVVFKIESHNHPSAVEPFQGAATGVGGIIRDIFAMGARPVALLNSLRFGNLTEVAPVGEAGSGLRDSGSGQGTEPGSPAAIQSPADAAGRSEQVNWLSDPPPAVTVVNWMTNSRRPLFERANHARAAVKVLREVHDSAASGLPGAAEVLAYCLLPDQLLLALRLPGVDPAGKEDFDAALAEVIAFIKAQLATVVAELLRPGEQLWETGFRATRKFDGSELDEAVKRIEYSPVQRGLAAQTKDYDFVSSVWRYGVCWPDSLPAGATEEKPQNLPYCSGVSAVQAARNRYLLSGVVGGISHYGNCIGIPDVGGELVFDPSYNGNCLVNAMCVGIVHKDKLIKAVARGAGSTALIAGARTGRDGVQGATFASAELTSESGKDRPAVQVGDPFMEKLLLEATLEIQGLPGLIGVQDFGAAGLTCSGVEMAARGGAGMRLDLDAVPQRASDLTAYEMMLSESQERMMLVVQQGSEERFIEAFRRWGLTAVPCGEVSSEQRLVVFHNGQQVAALPNDPLANEAPVYDRPQAEPAWYAQRKPAGDADVAAALKRILGAPHPLLTPEAAPAELLGELLARIAGSPNCASKQAVFEQYDYLVRGDTVVIPGGDSAVVRVKQTGQGLALTCDGPGRLAQLDPHIGGARAVLEAARNILAVGARPLGITNNLNFGNPENPERMWQLVQSIEGIAEACRQIVTPVTGGNVSLYNEARGENGETVAILPTPVIGMVGVLDRVERFIPSQCPADGLELFVLGRGDGRLDGSALLFELGRFRGGELGANDYAAFRGCERFLVKAGEEGALAACHDISDGGLALALLEMLPRGGRIDLLATRQSQLLPTRYDSELHNYAAALFSEEGQRWLVAVTPEKKGWLRTAALHYHAELFPIGVSGGGTLTIRAGERLLLEQDSAALRSVQHGALEKLLEL